VAGRQEGFARFGSATRVNNEISKVYSALDAGKRYRLTVAYNGTDAGLLQLPPPDSALAVSINERSVADVTGETDSKFDFLEVDADSSMCAAITVGAHSNLTSVTVGPISLQLAPEPIGAPVLSELRSLALHIGFRPCMQKTCIQQNNAT